LNSPDPIKTAKPYNASREVLRGVSWAILMRWGMRAIGLVSTVILARLLTPEDFGIAAMGMLFIGLLFGMSEFGTSMLLIRLKEVDRAHCDTAWTMTLLQHVVISLLLVLLAPLVAMYFKEPRVVGVIYVLAVSCFITGFSSVGPVLLRRELKFDADFRFNTYKKLLVFVATVTLAFILRDYWALVFGYLIGKIGSVLLSFYIHPYRAAWSLEKAPEYLRFALSIMPMRLANQLREMAPRFIVGSLGNPVTMGAFTVSSGLATLFTQEIVQPMGRGLFPNYTKLASNKKHLSAVYRKVLAVVALLALPVGFGVSAVASDLVALVLGNQWDMAVPLVQYLAIGGAIYAISHTMFNQILVAVGRERSAAVLSWVRLGVAVPILSLGLAYDGALGVAQATIVAPLVYLPLTYLETRKAVDLPLSALVGLLWRPVIGAGVMYMAIKWFHPVMIDWTVLRLVWDMVVGGSVFMASTLILWILSGKPQGAESVFFEFLKKQFD